MKPLYTLGMFFIFFRYLEHLFAVQDRELSDIPYDFSSLIISVCLYSDISYMLVS